MLPSNWFENSVCNGCEYGERITGGVFCHELQGLVPYGYQGCKAQNDFYDDQRKEEMGITLSELALELRKIFPRTKYVTVGNNPHKATLCPEQKVVSLFYDRGDRKPVFVTKYITPNIWGIKSDKLTVGEYSFYSPGIHEFYLGEINDLDLSEYADENGEIDYSKCIVEVE